MTLRLYMDEHVKAAVTLALRQRGYDVLTAQEDLSRGRPDHLLLTRATVLARVLVTHDEDFLLEGAKRQAEGQRFSGIIYSHQMALNIGQLVQERHLVVHCCEPEDLENQLVYLPLR